MTVSIIIATKTWQENLEECVGKCQQLDYRGCEIIILPDDETGSHPRLAKIAHDTGAIPVRIIPTGRVSPAKKRDIALSYAEGEILAFIDDDAYPESDWLKNALNNFKDNNVAAVGGPAITPPNDTVRQRASGVIYASLLVSGNCNYRYIPGKKREVDDYPSCNFLVRKEIMQALGGFNTDFWPGEDTKLCLDITKRLAKKIIYDPGVLVYHHRRPLFSAHLKQVASYALHRGYFVKRYPQTSLRLYYFIPAAFLAVLISGLILSLYLAPLRMFYFSGASLYLLLVLFFSIANPFPLNIFIFCGIILTHLTYGLYFIKGLLSRRLKEEK